MTTLTKAINVRIATKKINIKGPYVVLEIDYLLSSLVEKDGVNANLVKYDSPNIKIPPLILALVLI